jgi:hypothetical protein
LTFYKVLFLNTKKSTIKDNNSFGQNRKNK